MLFVGPALYLLAHVAFRWINVHSLSRQRVLTAAALVLAIPLCAAIPALASLAVLAGLLGALVTYEVVRYREARYRIRHAREEEALGRAG